MHVKTISTPQELHDELPISDELKQQVENHRQEVKDIISGVSSKKLIVVGPCSIHDPAQAVIYGQYLKRLQNHIGDKCLLVMRVYFEKPRTTVGWKGLVNDPELNGSFNMDEGLRIARHLCIELLNLGLPLATEVLDPFTIKYLSGIFSWTAIGARTTESQTHREIASGLPMAVGFKNSTSGDIQVALDAMKSSAFPHSYLGINMDGVISKIYASGNLNTHIILRGGKIGKEYKTNYSKEYIESLEIPVMVDCSHANCEGNFKNQINVAKEAIKAKNTFGLMIESNLIEGNQKISDNLLWGVSITDPCIDIFDTAQLIVDL
ncbi:phospho-2-dehydro-3-deoxyheptonate aldolase [Shigella phage vB_SdyM_006]|nr:phospho-2-dehydro-3-deoxyheptonate aldolase [Shigella phage vB_SdyM_006]